MERETLADDPIYIARNFYEWLTETSSDHHRKPNRAMACWELILQECTPGSDLSLGRRNYAKVFARWGELFPNHRDAKSTPRMQFRSAVQQAQIKADEWSGFKSGAVTLGIALECDRNCLIFNAKEKLPVTPQPEALDVLNNFYNAIADRRWESAWNCLAPSFRARRWSDNLLSFLRGYGDLVKMQDLQLVTRSVQSGFCVIDAFFEEKRELPVIPSLNKLSDWKTLTLGDVESVLPRLLDDVRREFLALGASDAKLNALPFQQLFHPDALAAIPWELGIPSDRMEEAYDSEIKTLLIARRVTLTNETGPWLIKKISWLSISRDLSEHSATKPIVSL